MHELIVFGKKFRGTSPVDVGQIFLHTDKIGIQVKVYKSVEVLELYTGYNPNVFI